jgi:hypothetical protein
VRYSREMLAYAANRLLEINTLEELRKQSPAVVADTLTHFGYEIENVNLKLQKRNIAINMGLIATTNSDVQRLAAEDSSQVVC